MESNKLCECGCGKFTNIARQNYPHRGVAKGEPFRFVAGHKPPRHAVTATGCWEMSGLNSTGYANHRKTYERFVGPVPDGMELDHLCKNRACVNPEHLEPVTPSQNKYRILAGRCRQGHLLDDDSSWITPQGYRRCRICNAEKSRRRREEKR